MKSPTLVINVSDFMSMTMALTPDQVGALLGLMMFYSTQGYLPADETQLRMIGRVFEPRTWRRIWPAIQPFLTSAEGDKLKIPMIDGWAVLRAPRLDVAATEWGRLRLTVFERDRFTCRYCGAADISDLHCDHVIPRAKGGPSTLENLVTSCGPCNIKKGAREPGEWLQ